MSAVLADCDGEPGGFEPAETVLHGQANGVTQAAKVRWAGRVVYYVLSLDGEPDIEGWDMPHWANEKRRAGGH